MRHALAVLVIATGCSGPAKAPVSPAPVTPVAQPVAEAAVAEAPPEIFPLHSEWAGRYVCGQGATAVRVTIDAHATGEAIATFEFSATVENPSVPSGAFQLKGRLQRAVNGGFEAKFNPDHWLEQPPGYGMVGFSAVTDPAHRVLRGNMDSPACSGIEVRRKA